MGSLPSKSSLPTYGQLLETLENSNLAVTIPSLPVEEFYGLVREIGLHDAGELLRVATTEQLQACIDWEGWQQEEVNRTSTWLWLNALLEVGSHRMASFLRAADQEWVVFFLKGQVCVYELPLETMPEEPTGDVYLTPDGFYAVELLSDAHSQDLQRLLGALYEEDPELARRLVMAAKWDVGAESEERAYRWHQGRLADMGYPPREDALALYQVLPLESVRLGEGTAVEVEEEHTRVYWPKEWIDMLTTYHPWMYQAMGALPEKHQRLLSRSLAYVVHQAFSVQGVTWADEEAIRRVMDEVFGCLCIGIESVAASAYETDAQKSPAVASQEALRLLRAQEALSTISVTRLFQLGYTVVSKLRQLARMLCQSGLVTLGVTRQVASLLPEPYQTLLGGLLTSAPTPSYCALLDGESTSPTRAFRSLVDVQRTYKALGILGDQIRLLTIGLGIRPEKIQETVLHCYNHPDDVRWTHLLGTLLGNLCLNRPAALVPLSIEDMRTLREQALLQEQPAVLRPAIRRKLQQSLQEKVKERSLSPEEEKVLWEPGVSLLQDTMQEMALSLAVWPGQKATLGFPWSLISGFLVAK